ncbi:heterokaryon incompatibility protein-domain-containing protein [Podospora appendiculata]|uniref:Heterokaryon incompatibility protein-domain-containing protein n=1 Tax=Podospora appendiculata TaxID=314037 RepID=A0AAE0XA56_9PEZI|nr:heterokaryon incompatibility protein-domain-containing protein [Podospora appendiculata]
MATKICDECRRMAAWMCESNSQMVGETNVWQDSLPSNEFPRSARHPLVLEPAALGCSLCVLIHRAASEKMAITLDPREGSESTSAHCCPKLSLIDWGDRRGPCKYVALSYSWGMVHPIKTTRASVALHRQGVDIESLPRTFRDVVTVARHLHVNFIWIDSLCIVQDDVRDWETECPRMGDVYRNAFLVVAASDAPDSTVGFLNRYCDHSLDFGQMVSLPCPKCSTAYPNMGADETSFFIEALPADPRVIQPRHKTRHLATRGWAFQERLLASRYLSVSSRNMEWECGECVQKDELHYPRSHSTWPDRKAN